MEDSNEPNPIDSIQSHSITCLSCKITFGSVSLNQEHLLLFKFACSSCQKHFKTKGERDHHHVLVHKKEFLVTYKRMQKKIIQFTFLEFQTSYQLKKTDALKYPCFHCPNEYPHPKSVVDHAPDCKGFPLPASSVHEQP
jgi:hypothetical protein